MRTRLALSLAATALVVAVLGTTPLGHAAYNAVIPANSIGALQLRNAAVTEAKLRGDAVTSGKVKDHSLKSIDFALGQIPAGPAGAKGDKGSKGSTGPTGLTGLTGLEIVTKIGSPQSGVFNVISAECPEGKKVVGGGASISPLGGAYYDDVVMQSSYPLTDTRWQAVGAEVNPTTGNWILEAFAICAKVT